MVVAAAQLRDVISLRDAGEVNGGGSARRGAGTGGGKWGRRGPRSPPKAAVEARLAARCRGQRPGG